MTHSNEYVREFACRASREQVYDAVASLDGLRRWWTPIVTGSAGEGGELTFGFEGLEESIMMRVEVAERTLEVKWGCIHHTANPEWRGTGISFAMRDRAGGACSLRFHHAGLARERVEPGWDRFLASLVKLVETGHGTPFAREGEALRVARAYHHAWTSKAFDEARRYLAPGLKIDVPVKTYVGRDDFAEAVATFGRCVSHVEMLAEFAEGDDAALLYDMHTEPFGTIRIAEQITVAGGMITRIRHVHDTAPFQRA